MSNRSTYPYPSKAMHDNEIKIRLDAETYRLIEALAQFHNVKRAVVARDLLEAQLAALYTDYNEDETAA